jgi:hypothetical protein
MPTDEPGDDISHQVFQLKKELDHFKDVVATAVSKLNARIKALEERLPPSQSRWVRFGARSWRRIAEE